MTGMLTDSASFTNPQSGAYSWLGPYSTSATDKSVTTYQFNQLGLVSDDNQTTVGLDTTSVYDAAGNLIGQTQTGKDSSNNTLTSTTSATFDALGRETSSTDAQGRKTSYVYTNNGTYNVTTTTNPDGGSETDDYFLDGMPASVSGTAATPAVYAEGVVTAAGIGAGGISDANVTAGSIYTSVTSGGTGDTTTTYTNMLGEQYLVQQSDPTTSAASGTSSPYADEVNSFDGNGREITSIGFDGTETLTVYDPVSGEVGSTITDLDKDGSYAAGEDRKSVEHLSAATTVASAAASDDMQDLADTGIAGVKLEQPAEALPAQDRPGAFGGAQGGPMVATTALANHGLR